MGKLIPALTFGLLLPAAGLSAATAQDTSEQGPIPVTGVAPTFCTIGGLQGADNVFDLGVLVDFGTGLLREDLAAPSKTLTGAFCNAASTISISATPIEAQTLNAGGGLSDAVDFTATASGWTTAPAAYSTSAASNPQATQSQPSAFAADIVVAIGEFSTAGGASLRLVADPVYQGSVTVTLTTAN